MYLGIWIPSIARNLLGEANGSGNRHALWTFCLLRIPRANPAAAALFVLLVLVRVLAASPVKQQRSDSLLGAPWFVHDWLIRHWHQSFLVNALRLAAASCAAL